MRKIENKIKTREEINEIAKLLSYSIVTTNGAFDMLHAGHLKVFEEAKEYGHVLIVGINSDNSIKSYKSKYRPVNNEGDRLKMVAALECVDYVTLFNEETPIEFLEGIKPQYHIKSKEGFKGLERDIIEENGGEILLIDDIPAYSTTALIQRITEVYTRERLYGCRRAD